MRISDWRSDGCSSDRRLCWGADQGGACLQHLGPRCERGLRAPAWAKWHAGDGAVGGGAVIEHDAWRPTGTKAARKIAEQGKSGAGRLDLGGRRRMKKAQTSRVESIVDTRGRLQ